MLRFEQLKLYPYRQDIINWLAAGRSRGWICHELRCDPRTLRTFLALMAEYNAELKTKRKRAAGK